MASWTIVDKESQSDEFFGFVYHNEGISNFAVRIASILSSSIEIGEPKFHPYIRLPYICIYFENVVLLFSDNKCDNVKLFKIFDYNIAGLAIQTECDKILVALENGDFILINIETGKDIKSQTKFSDHKLISVKLIEEDTETFIITSDSLTCYRLKILFDDSADVFRFVACQIKYAELSDNILIQIKIIENNFRTLKSSTFCLKSTEDDYIESVCPTTNQKILVTDSISGQVLQTFYNAERFLFIKKDSVSAELCIAKLYDYNVEFNIPVSKNCFVAAAVDDSAIYLDIVKDKIYIYQIQENSPLSQLEILISARNYEGAEAFAKQNNLSPEAVLELKAKCLLNNLKEKFSEDALQELQDILKSCDNIDFVINCCLEGIESSVHLFDLLDIAKKHFETLKDGEIKFKLHELAWKTEIFKLFELEQLDNDIDWQTFSKLPGLKLLIKMLSVDQLDRACLLWMKCYPFIIHNLTQSDIVDLLYCIPQDSKLNGMLRWLECFTTNIINIRPYSTDIIIKWAKERILLLENSKHWPEVGIQLAEKLIPLIFDVQVTLNFVSIETEKFYFLLNCLKNIQMLRKSYNIIIPLKDFMSLSREELGKLILRKAFTEDLDSLLLEFFEVYKTKHNINLDYLIKDHIEEVVNSLSGIDESKMEILLKYIHNIEDRLKCIILIVKSAQIPLTETMYKIAQSGVEFQHPLAQSIRTELIHGELRGILMKYKCHKLSYEDYDYLIQLIIRKSNSEMLSDIEKVTNVYSSLRNDAFLMCVQSYLKKSNVNLALKLYQKMDEDFQAMCLDFVLLKLENFLHSNDMNEEIESNYLDFLDSLDLSDHIVTYETLRNIFILKNKFKFKLSINDYSVLESRKNIFKNWCVGRVEECDGSKENLKQILIYSTRIGLYLKLSKTDCILILLTQVTENMLKTISSFMFLEYTNIDHDLPSIDVIIKLLPYLDCGNLRNIQVVLKHTLKALQICNYMDISNNCLNVLSWIMNIFYSHNSSKETLSSWHIQDFYNPHVITSITPIWNEMIYKSAQMSFKDVSFCFCSSDHCNDGSSCLPRLLSKLQTQQNDIHFLRISALYIMNQLKNNAPCPTWFMDLNESMAKNLMTKMLSLEHPDNLNISVLLLSISSPVDWLHEMLSDFLDSHRRINIAQYILRCKEMFRNVPYREAFSLFSQNNISTKLEKYGISLKEYQMENNTCNFKINALLESLINIESFNVLTLEELCMVTGISLDQALTFYLFSILKSWNTNYDIIEDSKGDKCVVVKNIHENILNKSITIVNRIKGKKELIENLTTLFPHGEINFQNLTTITLNQYCYEVFLFILDLLKYITGEQVFFKEFLMLKFLQTYQRTNSPTQTELDVYSIKETFPKIGYYRLPFQPLITPDCWFYLKAELTLETYERWLCVAGLLTLDVGLQERCDMIRSSAVRGTMASIKTLNETGAAKWSLHLQNEDLLKKAHKCIQNITHLEWAGACFYLVYQGSANGADQVAAAKMCYQFAEHSSNIQPNNILKKMKSKYLITSTAHVLYKIGLADEKFLGLCDSPQKLIEALFNHESILNHTECSNINNAVEEIARLNDLEISSIRINTLEKILNQSHTQGKSISEDGTLSKEAVIRACYILKGTNPMMAATYLSIIALQENNSLESYSKRIRALQCLLSLVDNDVIETVTHSTVINLWSKLWEFYFINSLCTVGLEFLAAIFFEDKSQAVQQIWNAREHNQFTIMLVLKIIFIYNVQVDSSFLDQIIKRMLKLGMLNEVRDFLLTTIPFYSSTYLDAWSNILLNPFKRLDNSFTSKQKEACYEIMKLLPVCSVVPLIDLTPIWCNCLKLGASDISAAVLPHVSPEERKKIVIKMGKVQQSLLQEIKSLKSKGIIMADIILASLKATYKKK